MKKYTILRINIDQYNCLMHLYKLCQFSITLESLILKIEKKQAINRKSVLVGMKLEDCIILNELFNNILEQINTNEIILNEENSLAFRSIHLKLKKLVKETEDLKKINLY